MKRYITSAFLLPFFFCSASVCDENITFVSCPMTRGPLDLVATADYFQKADGDDSNLPHGSTLQFGQTVAEVRPVIYADFCAMEFASLIFGYSNTLLKWHHPVKFKEDIFQIVSIGAAGLCNRYEDWTFTGYVTANFNVNRGPIDQYLTFNLFFDSTFHICEHIGLHGGFYAETGMKMDRIWPVIGFDWTISEKWQLNLVFPYDMALVYKYSPCFSFFLREHCFSFRSRLGNDPISPKSLVRYEVAGTEIGVIYANGSMLSLDAHIGYSSEGILRVANRQNNHSHRYHFKGTPYVGGKANLNF